MARAGLGANWRCLFANDFDRKKGSIYALNWGANELSVKDVAKVTTKEIPGSAELAWASFPCQDLSLAGAGAGLKGERSGTFWTFWQLVTALGNEGRAPSIVALENVCGTLTSHNGRDFSAIGGALVSNGYKFGALVIDAVRFLPQSRPRLFVIAVKNDLHITKSLMLDEPLTCWLTTSLSDAFRRLPAVLRDNWIWWNLPEPEPRKSKLADVVESSPSDIAWHSQLETQRLLRMMSPRNRQKVEQAKRTGRRTVGAIYKRTRDGQQRAEIRFDDVAGCLRTPVGGSSRQSIMIVEGKSIDSRLLSSREAARLMGLPDSYQLPESYNDAYHLAGDGVVVPVVRHLSANLLEPLLTGRTAASKKAA